MAHAQRLTAVFTRACCLTLENLLILPQDTNQRDPSGSEEMLQNQPAIPADFLNLIKC